ncbi:MAG: PrgI family protein, partial [Candidatus Staskawiczbacteria bacterium]|nr:PrgI family protein [Candidatus Staskawiczbacteria bacterium]
MYKVKTVFNRQNSSTRVAQYPIPQFIEAEGKIISFLTFRQFFWLVGGGGVCIGFYYLLPFFLFVILSLLVAIFVALVGFVKVNDMPVTTLIMNFLMFST